MRSYVTSYNTLFARRGPGGPAVERIEIPLIQRDYAQGREGAKVERIRAGFLDVLHGAVTGGEPVNLDFVYGTVESGTLRPLDGQQRLTTLFLLHWYLAFRAGRIDQTQDWKRFSYATRASARRFCERLTECEFTPIESVSAWIEDQHWFLHTWHQDPTIQSMLVMLDAMHERFRNDDCLAAWKRLVEADEPAISFHLLPIEKEMGLSEDLYIKMNSRGKSLTPFENFKARFEQLLETSCPERVEEFALEVDGAWADVLWPYRGSDSIVDDEFLSYFQFVTELCEWREGRPVVGNLAQDDIASLAERVYGHDNPKAAANLDFLFRTLDTWVGFEISPVFTALFSAHPAPLDSIDTIKVVLFGQQRTEVDLFAACCQSYGKVNGRNRVFSIPQTLLLYAVLLHRLDATPSFARRLRILRNLVEASSNELRLEKMPELLVDVQRIVVDGTLDGVITFNQAQVADERVKAELLMRQPGLEQTLFHLEDHSILRGCVAAFDLDEAVFERRARTFHRLFADEACWPSLTGALLAHGDYSRPLNSRMSQFGSGSSLAAWRNLLAGAGRSDLTATRDVLGRLLDAVAAADGDLQDTLDNILATWAGAPSDGGGMGWRWYFARYPVMRAGRSGIYVGVNGVLGYELCMLDKSHMNSFYRDPYLSAIATESGAAQALERQRLPHGPWFTGYETLPRWLRLKKSGTELQCVSEGLLLRSPALAAHAEAFARVCVKHGVGTGGLLGVPQVEREGQKLDTLDRVQIGAALVRDLVAAGL